MSRESSPWNVLAFVPWSSYTGLYGHPGHPTIMNRIPKFYGCMKSISMGKWWFPNISIPTFLRGTSGDNLKNHIPFGNLVVSSKWANHLQRAIFMAMLGGGRFKHRKIIGEVMCCDSWMAERTDGPKSGWRWLGLWASLSLSLPPSLPPSLSLSLSLSLPLSIYLSIRLSIYLSIRGIL